MQTDNQANILQINNQIQSKRKSLAMQYINVSQFYESIFCFSIPFLLIQRIILLISDLSSQYQDYRRLFYQDQFKFTKEFEYRIQQPPQQPTTKDPMIQKPEDVQSVRIQNSIRMGEGQNNQFERPDNKQKIQPSQRDIDGDFKNIKRTQSQDLQKQMKRVNKINIDLETDKQLKNSKSVAYISHDEPQSPRIIKTKTEIKKQQIQQGSQDNKKSPQNSKQNKNDETSLVKVEARRQSKKIKEQKQLIQESRMSKVTQSDYQVRRDTQFDRDSFGGTQPEVNQEQKNKQKEKVTIQLGTGLLQQKGQKDKTRMRYCRRIDDAFNDYIPIILSVVILGVITQSVYIYSMCCFFGYAFTSLLFNYIHLLDRLQGTQPTKSCFGRANQLISSLFIIGLFISYWISDQFY